MSHFYLISAAALLITPSVFAEDTPKEDEIKIIDTITVIGEAAYKNATLGGQSLAKLPVASHVINRFEIERISFVDPDEFLDRIPGETQVRNLRIPNGGKSYTVPLVDGVPLGNPYRGATQDITTINSFDIERVEVIKGPSSALFPNNAFGGVINVVTRDAPDEFEGKAWIEAGSFNRLRTGINAAGSSGDFGFFFDANTQNLDGLRKTYQNDRDQLSAKVTYTPSDATKIFIRYEYMNRDEIFPGDLRENEFYSDPTVKGMTAGSLKKIRSDAFSFKIEHSSENDFFEVSSMYRQEFSEGDSRFSPPQDAEDKSLHGKLMYRHEFDQSNLVLGTEYFKNDLNVDQYGNDDITHQGDILITSQNDLTIKSFFGQYRVDLFDRANLTLGVRHEQIDIKAYFPFNSLSSIDHGQTYVKTFKNTAPKVGGTYGINDDNLLWVSFSKGFLAPSIRKLFLNRPAANPNLKAENARNIEFGIRGEWGDLSYNSSYYNTRIDNYLVTEDDGIVETTTNAGQVTVQGVETVLEYDLSNQWRLSATHTYAKNIYDIFYGADDDGDHDLSGNRLSRSPDHHLNLRMVWEPIDDLLLEVEGDFYSSYYTRDDNSIDPKGSFKRGERINLRASYNIGQWSMWVHALNLTDTLEDRVSYSPPRRGRAGRRNFRIIDGRVFYAGIAYHF